MTTQQTRAKILDAASAIPAAMWAAMLNHPQGRLRPIHVPVPLVRPDEVLVRVAACGVCPLDVALVDGTVAGARYPVIPGHEVVGRVVEVGYRVQGLSVGDRVGVSKLGHACGRCRACRRGLEHLCHHARLTGVTVDGGMAEYVSVDHRFCVRLLEGWSDVALAPLLCAGAMAYRAMRLVGDAQRVGLYGPPSSCRLAADLARLRGRHVGVFGEAAASQPPALDAALVFAPARDLMREALHAVEEGGAVAWVGDVPGETAAAPVPLLCGERRMYSVAGAPRRDLDDLLSLLATTRIEPAVEVLPLDAVDEALVRLRTGRGETAVVLSV